MKTLQVWCVYGINVIYLTKFFHTHELILTSSKILANLSGTREI